MYKNLFEFYRSTEWESLRARIKLERLDNDGNLICAYCNKPIIKAYDAICHHVEYLTEGNVKDATIALNPDNIQVVHHKCHNIIHDKARQASRAKYANRFTEGYTIPTKQVFIVYGAPLSGKSEWVRENQTEGDLIIDIDNIWQCVSGLDRYKKPNSLKSVVFNIRDALIDKVEKRDGNWANAYIIGGFPFKGERNRLAKRLGARLIFIPVDKQTCIDRLRAEPNGRDVEAWTGYISEWFEDIS